MKLHLTEGSADAVGAHAIPAGGLQLAVAAPAVAPARLEIVAATIVLQAADGGITITEADPTLAITSDLGGGLGTVQWLIADWGEPRAVLSVTLASLATVRGHLKVAHGDVWVPLLAAETITSGQARHLPDVVASKLMIEIVDDAGLPSTGTVSGLALAFGAQPVDLTFAVGAEPPLVERRGRLLPGVSLTIHDGLAAALDRGLPRDGRAATIPVVIRDGLRGTVQVISAELDAVRVLDRVDGMAPGAPLPMDTRRDRGAIATVTLPDTATLRELAFTLVPDLTQERDALAATTTPEAAAAQLLDPTHEIAQPYPGLDAGALRGIDLIVRVLADQARGTVALHPDDGGRPAAEPYDGAIAAFDVARPAAGSFTSVLATAQLDEPLRLEDPFWLVARITDGMALWPLRDPRAAPVLDDAPIGAAQFRIGGRGPWSPCDSGAWVPARLRVLDRSRPSVFEVVVQRGEASVVLAARAHQRVAVAGGDLERLGASTGPLRLVISTPGRLVVGSIAVTDLRVVIT